jgi:hypothetical protein
MSIQGPDAHKPSRSTRLGAVDNSASSSNPQALGVIQHPKEGSTYVDMGKFYGSTVVGQMIRWWPEPVVIDKDKLDPFLNDFFQDLKANNNNLIELSFAQLQDIDHLLKGEGGSTSDTITQIFAPTGHDGPYMVGDTGKDFLDYFIDKAHENGIKVDLSFGGAIATPQDMTINGDGKQAANNLATFLNKYEFDSVDFDIEGAGGSWLMKNNTPENLEAFFTTLHSQMKSQGKSVEITVEGSLQNGPDGTLAPIFNHFTDKFDGVNMMLYSQSQYYLDADNETWGIVNWVKSIVDTSDGKATAEQVMKGLHIGFYDSIDYTNPTSSAGTAYKIPSGLTNGQAAAYVFRQIEQGVQAAYPDQKIALGDPFLWTDDPSKMDGNTFMKDFFGYLRKN